MPYFQDQSFDPDAVAAMRAAFQRAVDVLRSEERTIDNQKTLANAILSLAAEGERDAERLCAYALSVVPLLGIVR